nr:pentatricopeptide repeat-containing protein, mitochondrial [Quercus suber]
MVLSSVNRNGEQREGIGRVELDEDEIRHPLVREICRLIELRLAWNPKLEGELRHLLRSLKPRQVCAVLRSQADERVALKLFYWADRQWRYRHDPIVYYTMLEVLIKTKLCQGARRVLRLMARRGIVRRPEAFGYVMLSYSRAGKLRNAMQILTLMQRAGVDSDLSICNIAINVLVKGNKLEKALRFLARMQLVEITPNVVTCNSLIKGYCDLHRVEDAIELIAEMPLKGCYLDKVSYYTVMSFLCKEKRVKEVRELMDKMVKDSKLILHQVTYNTLIHMLSKHGHGDEALEFLREAEERGFHVDKGYSAIVHSFCKAGRIDIAK